MRVPNRFVELEVLESNRVLLVNDPYQEKYKLLASHDVLIYCETLHPLLDNDIEEILQANPNRLVIFVTTRQMTNKFSNWPNCKIIPVVSADSWYGKLLPKIPIDFNNKNIERYFISLNNRGQWDRHALFQIILNYELFDYCYFSYLMTDRFSVGKQQIYNQLSDTVGNVWYNQKLNINDLINKIPFIHDIDQTGLSIAEANPYNMLDIEKYHKSFFSVVSETYIDTYTQAFASEKIYKPLIAGQPLLTFCSPRILKKLKEQKFETFSLIFDESYDDEEDHSIRFDMMAKQLLYVCSLTKDDIADMYRKIKPICEYNYNYFWHDWPKAYELEIQQVKEQIEDLL